MHRNANRKATTGAHRVRLAACALLAAATVLAGCERGSESGPDESTAGPSGCPAVHARAQAAVSRAEQMDVSWNGPTTGPAAEPGKTIVYVAQTMTNPGVAGAAKGVREAARVIGWNVRVIDGGGTPAGIQAAMSQAVAVRPSGIVIGGFDPNSTLQQVSRANAAGIRLIGWHAVAAPGPSRRPELFTNVTTRVEDVAAISAQWIIADSGGRAGAVLITDASIPFAKNKSDLIRKELATCSGVKLLAYENIPIPDASSRTPRVIASLLSRFQNRWTHSVAINDLYFADAAPAFRAAGEKGSGPPFNIGAGDGDPSAFQRINSRQYQAATVPEPLSQQGWQIVDEFNRAFAGRPASGYVAPVHITTADNSEGATTWDPSGYREAYRKIWGK
ncbi:MULTISPECIES: substrate-binding domain-containing protein [unclassified Streptomyces]|uniref:substrate-binding domain-containing protein n=1 Tax=unclassified Streptomyces TaxID=2593676 RepID=UPI002366728C|nr:MULTISPECIES: substrate-binding domain-containing protein [unclassified Streptomyces]MDF3140028.1 substrate-binding domain-containing protein [Streptomyces sp. T21Q-yed]WDF43681.1 substrate-binding domain-containing protein [Streptomyces sp. T12]